MNDLRDIFFDYLYELAQKDERIIFLTADADAFSLKKFKSELPNRFINVGVAEQNGVLVASGLATVGYRPFIYSITPFLTMRAYEQIKIAICSHNLPVTLIGLGSGLSFGFDGPTHHAIHDIGIMRMLPNLYIFNPNDKSTCELTLRNVLHESNPSFIRLDKGIFETNFIWNMLDCNIRQFGEITDTSIFVTGTILHTVLKAVSGLNVTVYDVSRLYPIPMNIKDIVQQSKRVFVVEEHSNIGGLCDIIRQFTTKFVSMTLPHKQIFEYGERTWLNKKYGMDSNSINKTILENMI